MGSNRFSGDNSFSRLAAINRAITTSLNFNEVLRLIVVNAAELFSAETSFLLLLENDDALRVKAVHGADSEKLKDFSGRMEEAIVSDISNLLDLAPGKELVTAPVITNNTLSGFLAITRKSQLSQEEQWQMSALADQAAIALNNARFHEFATAAALRERDESLEALRQSNLKINRILGSITELFYQLDREWRFVDLNRRVEELFGKSREELLGKVIWEVFPQAVESELYPQFHKALEEMTPVHFELISKIVKGVWFEAHAYPSAAGLTVYLHDISERKKAEVTKHLLAAIVESSDDAIVSKDLNGIISSWNKGAERIFGYTAEETIGQPITMLIPPDRLDEETAILEQIRQGQTVDHYETVRRRKDGGLIDISLTISPIRNEAGNLVGASKIARDISERKLREEEILFQAQLLGAVEQAVIATDLDGVVTYWNAFAEKLYGWSAAEAVGSNILDLTPAKSVVDQASEVLARLREGQSWSGEFLVRRKDGSTFPAFVTDWPLVNPAGELVGIMGISVDITERKQAEEERARLLEAEREARAEAERANATKDEFLATLSHELRNPLNVILGYSEILLRSNEVRQSAFLKHAVEILRRNARSQSQLVRDLLDLSRLHMGKLSLAREAVSFESIINNAVETVRAEAAGKNIDLQVDISADREIVMADPLRLEQVVWNLLNNAVKFTDPGGSVTLKLANEESAAALTVTDSGQGIDPEFLPEVFEMFRQADAGSSRKHGGMGIGLALVRQLVELHGGTVAAASAGIGKGAEFTVRIPLSREAWPAVKTAPLAGKGALNSLRVLIVDDSRDTVEMLRHLLELEKATVTCAMSGVQALQLAAEIEFDVIVSDISMPGMDGFEFLRRLRTIPTQEHVPVVALTGFGRVEDVTRAEAEGFFTHVTKPLDVDHLLEILEQIPAKERESKVGA
jgi:PAS domain S-box-containing protein